jgi:hypothetical protein
VSYEPHLRAAETDFWSVETAVPWERLDRDAARAEGEILAALYDAAVIEGYLPVLVPRLMQMLWDDVDATAVLSIELFDGLKHYTALRRYLDLVGFVPGTTTVERLVAARERSRRVAYDPADVVTHLTNFACSELFAAYFFVRLGRQTREPVLRELLGYLARDEFRHSAAGAYLLERRIAADPTGGVACQVLHAARRFRHYGSDVVEVPVAVRNDFEAIAAFNRKIRALCGRAPSSAHTIPGADGDQ